MKTTAKKQIAIWASDADLVRDVARVRGWTQAALVRECIDAYLRCGASAAEVDVILRARNRERARSKG